MPAPTWAETLRFDVVGKLLLAIVLGGTVGLEREIARKPAGLRTNILICVGAALFTELSIAVAVVGFTPDGRPYGDATRIAAQIVSGIGFLGAGAILHGGGSVVGLTTAATVWVVAAIGTAVGAGAFAEAIGGTVVIMLVLVGLAPIERRILTRRRRVRMNLRVKPGVAFAMFEHILQEKGLHVFSHRTYEHASDRSFEMELIGATKEFEVVADVLRSRDDVISLTSD